MLARLVHLFECAAYDVAQRLTNVRIIEGCVKYARDKIEKIDARENVSSNSTRKVWPRHEVENGAARVDGNG